MTEKKEFTYEIGGKKYIQKPMFLGQIRQLMNLMQGIVIPHDIDTMGLVSLLGDKLPLALAIVLTPEGVSLKDKDIHSLASEIEFEISPETSLQAVEDFFVCNPVPSLLERLGGMAEKISKAMSKETGLKNSSAPLPEEILPKETESSGATH